MALTSGPLYDKLLKVYESWKKDGPIEFRWFRCALCSREIVRANHIWLDISPSLTMKQVVLGLDRTPIYVEVHLCRNCGKKEGLDS